MAAPKMRVLVVSAWGFGATGALILDEITGWTNLSYGWATNRGVSCEVELPRDSSAVSLTNSIYPITAGLCVVRDDVVVWMGPITAMQADSKSNTIRVSADDWVDMLKRLRDWDGYSYTDQDVKTLITNIMTNAGYGSSLNFGVLYAFVPDTAWGVTNSASALGDEFANIGEQIEGLSRSPSKGFDYYTAYSWNAGRPVATLTFEFPKRGGSGTTPDEHLWHKVVDGKVHSNMLEWNLTIDGKRQASRLFTTGFDTGGGQLTATDTCAWLADITPPIFGPGGLQEQTNSSDTSFANSAGYPIQTWDLYTRPELMYQSHVDDAGDARIAQIGTPIRFFTASLDTESFGNWGASTTGLPTPGDLVKVTIEDGSVFDFTETHRITEVQVRMAKGLSERVAISSSRLTDDIT